MKRVYILLICLLTIFTTIQAEEAQWICASECNHTPNCWQIFRKNFNLSKRPDKVEVRISADSKYWLWINGELVVFEGSLKRGPSPGDCYYDIVDISKHLRKGDNSIAVLTWFFGKGGFSHHNSGKAGLFFEGNADGVSLNSGNSWLATIYTAYKDTDAPHPNFRLHESNIRFDAREQIDGWQERDYDDSAMKQAVAIAIAGDKPFGKMVKRPIPMWKDYGLKKNSNVIRSAQGDTLICTLPYNCQMTPYIKLKAEAGKTIHIITDNYRGGDATNIRAEYITRNGKQEYENYGWMNGHKVYYIIPEGVEVLDVKFRETGYNTEFSGYFNCNDEFLNELWKRSARTLYITMRDNYMDCPDRERAQWWGDEVNELGEAFYALSPSSHKLATKGIHELMNWQRPDGTIFSPCPATTWDKELPLQMLASVGWYGFHTQYYFSGDSSFIPIIYDRVHRYLHDVWQTDEDGLAIVRHGGWSWGDWGSNIDLEALTSCWYYLALKAEKRFALMIGKNSDAEECETMMQRIKTSFNKRYWNGKVYRTPSYKRATDDRVQAMAVVAGIADSDKYEAIAQTLQQEFHASPYMEKYVLEALCLMGKHTQAIERMKLRYKKMLSYEYTTLFEGWGIGKEGVGGGTINHAWTGGPLTILSQYICGVAPTSPSFRTFKVEPNLGSLTEVATTVSTNHGNIEVDIKKTGSTMILKLKVPKGCKAEVPIEEGKTKILLSGRHKLKLSCK